MKSRYFYRGERVRRLKEGVSATDYMAKHPDAVPCCKPPGESRLEEWANDGVCEALDGCRVEPDGTCQHGKPSWLMALGFV